LHWLLSKSFNPIGIELENTSSFQKKLAKLVRIFTEAILKQIFEYPRKKLDIKKFLLKPTESNTVKNL
jgi:hypothetical protein